MGTFVERSLNQILNAKKENNDVVIRIETNSGSPQPRVIKVLEVHEDYIVGRGRDKSEPEFFNFNHVSSWRFAKCVPEEWKWKME